MKCFTQKRVRAENESGESLVQNESDEIQKQIWQSPSPTVLLLLKWFQFRLGHNYYPNDQNSGAQSNFDSVGSQ